MSTTTSTQRPTDPLVEASVRIILDGQAASGGYVASPNFPTYHFGWLRDGSYVALAMDAAGERESASRFHAWIATVVLEHAADIRSVVADRAAGRQPSPQHLLPARYTLDGAREPAGAEEEWPNFQLDGYGTWLFALREHLGDDGPGEHADAVRLAADYLVACWEMPCYDYWEEFGDRRHTATLGAICAGLRAASTMLSDASLRDVADEVEAFVRSECVVGGALVKGPQDDRVDASLVSLSTPFGILAPDEPVMRRTVERIVDELTSPSGGTRRYVGDTYYGGNPWILLTAWLGWHHARAGDRAAADAAARWVRGTAAQDGLALAEQTLDEPQPGAEAYVKEWTDRWGPVADPLLWSHAKLLLLLAEAGR